MGERTDRLPRSSVEAHSFKAIADGSRPDLAATRVKDVLSIH
jgi:hypothetical protein